MPYATFILLLCLLVTSAPVGCGPSEPTPRDQVRQVVSLAAKHQSAMLGILEQHQHEPERAVALLEAYVSDHRAEIELLAQQRPLLERESTAFAEAWRQHGQTLIDRRRRLAEVSADLMSRLEVTRALSCFDAL